MNIKPTVVVSKCLGFEACRYNGQMQKDDFVQRLKDFVNFITVCPEVEIGLQIPRESIRIVNVNEHNRIIQPKTGRELSKEMYSFSRSFLDNLNEVDGFILKSRSPSCGIKDVRIYNNMSKEARSIKGMGVFGGEVLNKYSYLAVEDEGRLKNYKIREHFLTKLYTMSKFRNIKNSKCIKALMNFHDNNRLLFACYNKKEFKKLDAILKNIKVTNVEELFSNYQYSLSLILTRVPRYTSNISIMIKVLGEYINELSEKEKKFMLDTIEKYRKGNIPFTVPLYLLKSYVIRFNDKATINQSFFEPYPHELVEMRDSGKVLT